MTRHYLHFCKQIFKKIRETKQNCFDQFLAQVVYGKITSVTLHKNLLPIIVFWQMVICLILLKTK